VVYPPDSNREVIGSAVAIMHQIAEVAARTRIPRRSAKKVAQAGARI
jgi:hypothetical protein